jgi:hypothetical protein
MSIRQAAEQSVKYADLLALLTDRYEELVWGSPYAAGTRVFARVKGRGWQAFLVTDLPASNTTKAFALGLAARTTVSLTAVSTGYGFSFIPNRTGQINFQCSMIYKTDTALDGVLEAVYTNTTGVPGNGVAVGTDTLVLQYSIAPIATAADTRLGGFFQLYPALAPFLAIGSTNFFYVAHAAVTGGTATTSNVRLVGIEV